MSLSIPTALKRGGRQLLTPTSVLLVILIGLSDRLLGASLQSFLYRHRTGSALLGEMSSEQPLIYYAAPTEVYLVVIGGLFIVVLFLLVVAARAYVFEVGDPSAALFIEDARQIVRTMIATIVLFVGIAIVALVSFAIGRVIFTWAIATIPVGEVVPTQSIPAMNASFLSLGVVYGTIGFLGLSLGYAPFVTLTDDCSLATAFRKSWSLTSGTRIDLFKLFLAAFLVALLLGTAITLPLHLIFSTGSPAAISIVTGIGAEVVFLYLIAVFSDGFHQLREINRMVTVNTSQN